MTTKKQASEAEKTAAAATLRKLLKPGDTVYTILRHRNSAGTFRVIDLVVIDRDQFQKSYPLKPADQAAYPGEVDYAAKPSKVVRLPPRIRSIGHLAAKLTGYAHDNDRGGLRMGGGGMDMGFAAVYALGSALWPKGTPKPHGTRNGEPDRAGGYALKHSWL